MTREDGGRAFACASDNGYQEGMSLRDWFAGMALHSAMLDYSKTESVVERAYEIADAMLRARTGEAKQ